MNIEAKNLQGKGDWLTVSDDDPRLYRFQSGSGEEKQDYAYLIDPDLNTALRENEEADGAFFHHLVSSGGSSSGWSVRSQGDYVPEGWQHLLKILGDTGAVEDAAEAYERVEELLRERLPGRYEPPGPEDYRRAGLEPPPSRE